MSSRRLLRLLRLQKGLLVRNRIEEAVSLSIRIEEIASKLQPPQTQDDRDCQKECLLINEENLLHLQKEQNQVRSRIQAVWAEQIVQQRKENHKND